jgi:cytochrome c5
MRLIIISMLMVLFGLSACSSDEDVVVHKSGESWREGRLVVGRDTYNLACASCHDTGKMDAPLIGNPKDWSGRSDLWDAVLAEHAKTGYLEMPEKGGHPELSDEQIESAAEFMLHVTFPDKPQG